MESPTGLPRLPDDVLDHERLCERCRQPGAELCCKRCSALDVGSLCLRYCSHACLEGHWPAHRKRCTARRALFRAIRTMASIWDQFLILSYAPGATVVDYDETTLYLLRSKEAEHWGVLDPRVWTGRSVIETLPDANLPADLDSRLRLALVYHGRSADIISLGNTLIRAFLQRMLDQSCLFKSEHGYIGDRVLTWIAMCVNIWELKVTPVSPCIQVIWENDVETREPSPHTVLLITLPGNDNFVIDLTGMQYGWAERVYPAEAFFRYRGQLPQHRDLDEAIASSKNAFKSFEPHDIPRVLDTVRRSIAMAIHRYMPRFFRSIHDTPAVLFKRTDQAFHQLASQLVDAMGQAMVAQAHDLLRRGVGRMFVDISRGRQVVKAVGTLWMQDRLNKIWFTEEEYDQWKHDPDRLEEEWAARCEKPLGTQTEEMKGVLPLARGVFWVTLRGITLN